MRQREDMLEAEFEASIVMARRERDIYQAVKRNPQLKDAAMAVTKEDAKRRAQTARTLLSQGSDRTNLLSHGRDHTNNLFAANIFAAVRRAILSIELSEKDLFYPDEAPIITKEKLFFPDSQKDVRLTVSAMRALEDAICQLCDRVLTPELERWDHAKVKTTTLLLSEHDANSVALFQQVLDEVLHIVDTRHQRDIQSRLQLNEALRSSIHALKVECKRRDQALAKAHTTIGTLQAQSRSLQDELATIRQERDSLKRQLNQAWRAVGSDSFLANGRI